MSDRPVRSMWSASIPLLAVEVELSMLPKMTLNAIITQVGEGREHRENATDAVGTCVQPPRLW